MDIIHPSVSELDWHRFVINNKDFLQKNEENISKFDRGWMRNVRCNAFYALKGRLENMSETLMQVLNADVLSPVKKMKKQLRRLANVEKPMYESPKLSILLG